MSQTLHFIMMFYSANHNSADCIDDGTEEEDTNQNSEPEESPFTHEDVHEKDRERSPRDSDSEEFVAVHDDTKVEGAHLQDALYDVPTHAHTPTEAHQVWSNSADLEANLVPQIPNHRGTGRNFIHRFFWGLQQGIETRIENIDADTISPFLV
ncbi:hypothetical protein B0H16DRAFT_1581224 [Mycena metata]|uniref:Uncharacterized protein n=1 Tax=Mycena metata TaxID=1033252 RepID=A0AAD7I223_9AGAR|nr:hypothetical protein B0H16DRAFT_1581224 [Mycena metata]